MTRNHGVIAEIEASELFPERVCLAVSQFADVKRRTEKAGKGVGDMIGTMMCACKDGGV